MNKIKLCCPHLLTKQESLANANVKRATAVHAWRPLSKKSKRSRKYHARSKRHSCLYLV